MTNSTEYVRRYRRAHPLYDTWAEMLQRCGNPKKQNYARYGGRGITVCERWRSFEAFEADMSPRPLGGTLDRVDNDGDYSPENCRWATMREQSRNKRTNRVLTLDGRSQTVADWAEEVGIPSSIIRQRIDRSGWSVRDALTRPRRSWGRTVAE